MPTIAVTGASGFIGAALCNRLRADGDEVIAAGAWRAVVLASVAGRGYEFAREPRGRPA